MYVYRALFGRACTFNSVQLWLPFCFLSGCPLSDNSKEAHAEVLQENTLVGSATCFADNYRKGAVGRRAKVGRNFRGRENVPAQLRKRVRDRKNDAADDAAASDGKGKSDYV